METLKKNFSTFDSFLFGGLGCGALVLCILGSAFVYLWQNPPSSRPAAAATPPGIGDMTPTVPGLDFATPTFAPTLLPTL
ncbi:MAG TPA: hypothetical protein VK900_11305, partial [Anaerolineales bacterium]|nr:hypothetical protein [Anaerolineales bacterium]